MRGRYGDVLVRDHSEMLVILETLIREDYNSPDLPDTADLVLDVGCNIGTATLWLARRYPSAKIVAVEVDPETVKIARRNLEGTPNVTVIHAAVSDHSGRERFFIDRESWASSTLAGKGTPLDVPAVSLDDLIAMGGPRRVLKIDVEGAEHHILRGSRRLREIEFITGEYHTVEGESYRGMVGSLAGFDVHPPADVVDTRRPFTASDSPA
jgi:FkbM family methyltransferase